MSHANDSPCQSVEASLFTGADADMAASSTGPDPDLISCSTLPSSSVIDEVSGTLVNRTDAGYSSGQNFPIPDIVEAVISSKEEQLIADVGTIIEENVTLVRDAHIIIDHQESTPAEIRASGAKERTIPIIVEKSADDPIVPIIEEPTTSNATPERIKDIAADLVCLLFLFI